VKHDLLIRGATVVTSQTAQVADLAVHEGRITAIAPSLDVAAARVIEATGDYLLPGFIDAHVHFNEPGRADWEGVATGSAALAAGGGTLFIDMPLNSSPPLLDAAAFAAKANAIESGSILDAALWGGLVPGNLSHLRELAACGVIGFKAFMSASGLDDFPSLYGSALREGMKIAAELGLPVAVHAENDKMTAELAQRAREQGRTGIADYLRSRPIAAELEAISEAVGYALETGCPLHVVHVSTRAGLEIIAAAKKRGADVTAETCPHYLVLDENDLERLGAVAKCAPPLRPAEEVAKLRRALGDGLIDTIGSDHSPAPPDMKMDPDFFRVWGGISGCQHALPLFFEAAVLEEKLPLPLVAQLTATHVARRFRLAGKGDLVEGRDADMVLLSANSQHRIERDDLRYRHRQSPYVGRGLGVAVRETWARGESVAPTNRPQPRRAAQILRPTLL
jgi:allantoinase